MSPHAQASALAVLESAARNPRVGEFLWCVRSDDGTVNATWGDQDRPFFIASATKLMVTAVVAQLADEGALSWDAPLSRYLPDLDLSGLSRQPDFTVRQVLEHRAGLPDYFEGKRDDGFTTLDRMRSCDEGWELSDVIGWSRRMSLPATGEALYSDTGFQLIGAVIESVTGASLRSVLDERVCRPVGMASSFLFCAQDIPAYEGLAVMRDGSSTLHAPMAMASVQADGGMVSTVADGMLFLDAFFGGTLFSRPTLMSLMSDWHRIFYPFQYGAGVMRFQLPRLFTGLRRVPPFYGHSGASGTVMFRSPDWGLTIVGTVNQVQHRSLPFRIMVKAAVAAGPRRSS
jgi:D-alanyl-D-alanine carboxypeptidase